MNESDRHKLIREFLRDRPFATVRDLVGVTRASPATVRRDITKLHSAGAVRKVFGGISTMDGPPSAERLSALPFKENQLLGVEAKKAIAVEAERLVRDGDAIIIHGGSTCYLFALRLMQRNVKIFTNSMPLAAKLWEQGVCHLTVAGGELHREPGILFSPGGGSPEFYASKFFLGAQGIGPGGITESHPLIVRAARDMLARADEVIVLADSRKFNVRARYHLVSLSRIGTLITDDGLKEQDGRMLEDAGVKVIVSSVLNNADRP